MNDEFSTEQAAAQAEAARLEAKAHNDAVKAETEAKAVEAAAIAEAEKTKTAIVPFVEDKTAAAQEVLGKQIAEAIGRAPAHLRDDYYGLSAWIKKHL